MYPFFLIGDIQLYTFGITLIIVSVMFIWMLRKLSKRLLINFRFFSRNFLLFLLAVLVSGRIFYFLEHTGEWGYSLRYGLEAIIFSANYHLSLIGCILGFLAILFLKVESFDLQKDKYLDIAVISFLFASWVGWIGGFIGETIYGANTTLPIGISYNNPITTVPLGGDLLPLGIIYALFTFLLFFTTYTLRQTTKIHGLSASVGLIGFSLLLFIGEFFDGARGEGISIFFGVLSLTQISCIFLCILGSRDLFTHVITPLRK